MSLVQLLEQTKFKKDAKEIARQLAKRGIDRLELLGDAPGRLQSVRVWGHPLSEVIDAIRKAAEDKPLASAPTNPPKGDTQGYKSIETKPFSETPQSEPGKPVGGNK